ncbi:MAG TPA: MFS transporter [Pirellulales bacterium]
MQTSGRMDRIELLNFSKPQMRAFHMAWFAFFVCFFAWFGIAPLMQVVRGEFGLTARQVGWCVIGSVAITVLARIFVGWLCDRIGPRLAYSGLLLIGSLPVMAISLVHSFEAFLILRVLIGMIGASFVITQYHTSKMFSSNCVGTANAMTAGWGNLGGGVTQAAMPLIFAFFAGYLGYTASMSWRLSMVLVGLVCAATGIAYFFLTQDFPEGNLRQLRAAGKLPPQQQSLASLREACGDRRVWTLFLIYGACFGIELTMDNVAVLYFVDYFDYFKQLSTTDALKTAGLIAAMFGSMNLFARALGGWIADKCGHRWGLDGRVKWLFLALFGEGIGLICFSQATVLWAAIPLMIVFALFVKMSNGATYAIVPFVNRRALGAVSGVVGAGGNAGAVVAGLLFAVEGLNWHAALFIMGAVVTLVSFLSLTLSFESEADLETEWALPDVANQPQPAFEIAAAVS